MKKKPLPLLNSEKLEILRANIYLIIEIKSLRKYKRHKRTIFLKNSYKCFPNNSFFNTNN